MKISVIITLKKDVLDPQGKVIQQTLQSMGINTLKSLEINSILKNTRLVLKKAILLGGSSIKNFSNSSGKEGNFQQYFNVYGRKGIKCSNYDCKGIIKKINISNRASFFCSFCQK